MTDHTRRSVLKYLGASALVAGTAGSASAQSEFDSLRLFGEQRVTGSMETVVQGNHAYVANGSGMHVVDWHNPGQPETVATVDLDDVLDDPTLSVLDVKVDGDLAVLANDTEDPGGVAIYDVSDPTDPRFLSFYAPDPPANVHNCFVDGDHVYLGLSEPWNVETGDGDPERDLVWVFGDTALEVVDASDPTNPTRASKWFLKDLDENLGKASVNPLHDVYVQDGLAYCAFWDAGTVILDVSDPTDPQFLTRFGAAPGGDDALRPWRVDEETFDEYLDEVFPLGRYLGPPGNAHYVQPAPDGDHVYVGAETFVGDPGGIDVWDVRDLNAPQKVDRIDPPTGISGLHTSHNFDVTANRLHASWYLGGVRIYDVSDPTDPVETATYNPEGIAFWTAVAGSGFTIGGVYGALSGDGGIAILHDDEGEKRPPAFSGEAPPTEPEVDVSSQEAR